MDKYIMNTSDLKAEQREALLGLSIYTQQAKGNATNAVRIVAEYYEKRCNELMIGFNLIHKAKRRSNIMWLQLQ